MNRQTPSLVPTAPSAPAARPRARGPAHFGRLQMSVPEVRNSLRDLTSRSDERNREAREMLDEAAFVEDALRDWAFAYPNNPTVLECIFGLATLYREIGTAEAIVCVDDMLDWLANSFLTRDCTATARRAMP